MIYLIPDAAFLITSPLSAEAYLAHFQANVEEPQRFRFAGTHGEYFEGEITDQTFRLRRLRWLSSKSIATIEGRVEPAADGGSLIHIEMQIAKNTYLRLAMSVALLALLRLNHWAADDGLWTSALIVSIYAGVIFFSALIGFNLDVARTTKILENIGQNRPDATS